MKRLIILAIALVVIITTAIFVNNEAANNWIKGVFTESETQVENPEIPNTDATTGTAGTESTEAPEVSEDENVDHQEEVPTDAGLTFAEFVELATNNELKSWNVAPEGATIFDLTADEFVVETEEEQEMLEEIVLMVSGYGTMTVSQEGFENKEAVEQNAESVTFELCKCSLKHSASWDADFGQFNWVIAEGNNALSAKCWTRTLGQETRVLVTFEDREVIRQSACYWYVENEDGTTEKVYGIRVCGDQKDPVKEEPKEEPKEDPKEEVKTFVVSHRFVSGTNGKSLPSEVTALVPANKSANEGSVAKPTAPAKTTVKVPGGTWSFQGWNTNSIVVDGNEEFTGTWKYTEDAPVIKTYTISHRFVSGTNGKSLPSEVTALVPANKSANEGSVAKPTAPAKTTVKVPGGTWVFQGWNTNSIVVDGNEEFVGTWKYTEDAPVINYYKVSFQFVSAEGQAIPAAVMNKLPATMTVREGERVNLSTITFTYEDGEGLWSFRGWETNNFVANQNTTVTGVWTYLSLAPFEDEDINTPEHTPSEDDNTPEHTPDNGNGNNGSTEEFVDPNPVASEEEQEILDQLVPNRTDVVEEDNTPVHSKHVETTETTTVTTTVVTTTEEKVDELDLADFPEESDDDVVVNVHTTETTDVKAAEEKVDELDLADFGDSTETETDDIDELGFGDLDLGEFPGDNSEGEDNVTDDSVVADQDTQNELDALFGPRS